jgi:phage gp36-like protein
MAASSQTAATLTLRYGVSESTVYKWKGRDSFNDASHTPQRLQTTLTPAQEQIVVELRKRLLLPLDDLLAVTRESLCPQATRWVFVQIKSHKTAAAARSFLNVLHKAYPINMRKF